MRRKLKINNDYVSELTTQNFKASINASEYAFVLVFDPRSESSRILLPEFESVAETFSAEEYSKNIAQA